MALPYLSGSRQWACSADDGHRLELRFDDALLMRTRGDISQFHKAAGEHCVRRA